MDISEQLRKFINGFIKVFISNETIVQVLVSLTMIIFWVLFATIALKLVKALLLRTKKYSKVIENRETKEQITIKRLINNIIRALFVFWILIMILREIGIDIVPLLAGAGVLAFAIGFGSQELMKDFISGFFLIIEKTYGINDAVRINGFEGVIIDVGIRVTKLLTWKNETITINNGDIRTVVNLSLRNSIAVIETRVDRGFDIEELYKEDFNNFIETFKKTREDIIFSSSNILITEFNDHIVFRITFETKNRQNFAIETAFRMALINYFKAKNIEFEINSNIKLNSK